MLWASPCLKQILKGLTPLMPAFLLPDGLLHVVSGDNFVLGSDPKCQVRLQGEGVAPRHLIVQRTGENWQAALLALKASTWHNSTAVTGLVRLNEGDVLRLGDVSVRWLPTVARVAAATPDLVGVAPTRRAPAWMWVLLGAAVMTALYGSWMLWDRWQTASSVATAPIVAVSPTAPVEAATMAPATPPPVYQVVLVLATATPLPEASAEAGQASTAAPTDQPAQPEAPAEQAATVTAPTEAPAASPTAETAETLPSESTPVAAQPEAPAASPPAETAEALPSEATPVAAQPEVEASPTSTPPTASPTPAAPQATVAPTAAPAAVETQKCLAPNGWRQITVKRAQTVRELARRYGTSAVRLAAANCLESNRVRVGQQVYVPPR